MFSVTTQSLPEGALLESYKNLPGHYTDCFALKVKQTVGLENFVQSFYTSWLFKLERWLIGVFANKRSTDQEAAKLASGELDAFSAWSTEARSENELLMRDISGKTRSWFKVEKKGAETTLLMFGSAVVPEAIGNGKEPKLGFLFKMLLGFHKLYSRALLSAAASNIKK